MVLSRKKTHEEFVAEMAELHPNIEVLSQYDGAHTKVRCRCQIDGAEWETKPNVLLNGSGCKVCGYRTVSTKLQHTFEDNIAAIRAANPNIDVLGRVFDNGWKVHCRCQIDGYEWIARPDRVANGDGCSRCAGREKKTTETFRLELAKVHPDIDVIGTYCGTHVGIRCRCRRDGHVWNPTPRNLLAGWGCPSCSMSRGERRIANYLEMHGIDYEREKSFADCKDEHVLLFDFYIPALNMAIEYDGEQHFRPVQFGGSNDTKAILRFERGQKHDQIKNNYCRDNGIILLRIDYTQYDEVETILDKHLL